MPECPAWQFKEGSEGKGWRVGDASQELLCFPRLFLYCSSIVPLLAVEVVEVICDG
jgi:hypothetical protein